MPRRRDNALGEDRPFDGVAVATRAPTDRGDTAQCGGLSLETLGSTLPGKPTRDTPDD